MQNFVKQYVATSIYLIEISRRERRRDCETLSHSQNNILTIVINLKTSVIIALELFLLKESEDTLLDNSRDQVLPIILIIAMESYTFCDKLTMER